MCKIGDVEVWRILEIEAPFMAPKDLFPTAGTEVGDHVTLIPTPGHTSGHVSVLVKSNDKEAVITGDAIHRRAQCWHPDGISNMTMTQSKQWCRASIC